MPQKGKGPKNKRAPPEGTGLTGHPTRRQQNNDENDDDNQAHDDNGNGDDSQACDDVDGDNVDV